MSATNAAIDAMALLASMAQTTEKKKGKAAKPEVNNPEMDATIGQWIEADKEVKKWEGIRTTAEAQILAFARPARLQACRAMGRVESSIKINGKIRMTQKCQYTAIPAEHLPTLEEAFGADAVRYFKPQMKLELNAAAAENKELLSKLIAALGPELFAASFSVKRFAVVTETFHNDVTLKPDVEAKARPFMESEAIKQYKPSLGQ